MADIRLFDKTMLVLEKALDYQMQKQQVIAAMLKLPVMRRGGSISKRV